MLSKPNKIYESLISRNIGFLSKKDQHKIKNKRLFLIGCGMGSQIGVLSARTGFTKFILADGDKVEISNLNRQAFSLKHIGKNKAKALAELIKEINPKAEILIYPEFVKENKRTEELIYKSDLIVNMVDPDETLYFINQKAREYKKPVFFPLNIGFGGYLIVFTPESLTLKNILGKKVLGNKLYKELVSKTLFSLPHYLRFSKKKEEELLNGKIAFPQLGIACYITSTLVVSAMVRYVLNEHLPISSPITIDIFQFFENSSNKLANFFKDNSNKI